MALSWVSPEVVTMENVAVACPPTTLPVRPLEQVVELFGTTVASSVGSSTG